MVSRRFTICNILISYSACTHIKQRNCMKDRDHDGVDDRAESAGKGAGIGAGIGGTAGLLVGLELLPSPPPCRQCRPGSQGRFCATGLRYSNREVTAIAFGYPREQLTQTSSIPEPKPAFTFIAICTNNRQLASLSVRTDHNRLVLDRVLLMVGRHADVLSRSSAALRLR
jgi:hypothetical protein